LQLMRSPVDEIQVHSHSKFDKALVSLHLHCSVDPAAVFPRLW
jgi:hypothetical protein